VGRTGVLEVHSSARRWAVVGRGLGKGVTLAVGSRGGVFVCWGVRSSARRWAVAGALPRLRSLAGRQQGQGVGVSACRAVRAGVLGSAQQRVQAGFKAH